MLVKHYNRLLTYNYNCITQQLFSYCICLYNNKHHQQQQQYRQYTSLAYYYKNNITMPKRKNMKTETTIVDQQEDINITTTTKHIDMIKKFDIKPIGQTMNAELHTNTTIIKQEDIDNANTSSSHTTKTKKAKTEQVADNNNINDKQVTKSVRNRNKGLITDNIDQSDTVGDSKPITKNRKKLQPTSNDIDSTASTHTKQQQKNKKVTSKTKQQHDNECDSCDESNESTTADTIPPSKIKKKRDKNDTAPVTTPAQLLKLQDNIYDNYITLPQHNTDKYVGAHISMAGGHHYAVLRAAQIGARAFAIDTKSKRQWNKPELPAENCELFTQYCNRFNINPAKHILPHGSYLCNLASPDSEIYDKSLDCLIDELDRCHKLGIMNHNIHPGMIIQITLCI